jgi:hypothetical protein
MTETREPSKALDVRTAPLQVLLHLDQTVSESEQESHSSGSICWESLERRRTRDGTEGIQEVTGLLASGGEDRGPDGRGLGAPGGAEAAGDLAVDDGGAQVALGVVVGRLDVVAGEEDVQASRWVR